MKGLILFIAIVLLIIVGCGGGNPIESPKDTEPPVWQDGTPNLRATVWDGEVTLEWNLATDSQSPPVVYLVYFDTDSNPWDQQPVERTSNAPYKISGLTNDVDYWFSVRAQDSATPPNMENNTETIQAIPTFPGWIRTWGGIGSDHGRYIAIDDSGNLYVLGTFYDSVDFDPSPDFDITSLGDRSGIFLSKFDSNLNFLWVRTFSSGSGRGEYLVLDDLSNIYIAGYFYGTVDFDPGAGVYELTEIKGQDSFLCKLDSNGNFMWAQGWGGNGIYDACQGATIDSSGNVLVTGAFENEVDFDPSSGVDNQQISEYGLDFYLSKFDANGNYQWALTWGGENWDTGGIAVKTDNTDNIYVAGAFRESVDFDPGIGTAVLTSNDNSYDSSLVKFTPNGDFVYAISWGSSMLDSPQDMIISNDYILISGMFGGTADLDPGAPVLYYTAIGVLDLYLSKFDLNGNLLWAKAWGGVESEDGGVRISIDGSGNIFTTGLFRGSIDLDPGIAISEYTSIGDDDIFISKLDSNGEFLWGCNLGATDTDWGFANCTDASGNVYITGSFMNSVDFDPSSNEKIRASNGEEDVFLLRLKPDSSF